MKKIISILMIAALAAFVAVGCSTPEAEGTKSGDSTSNSATSGDGKGPVGAPGVTDEGANKDKMGGEADKDKMGGDASKDKMGGEAPKTDAPKTDAPKTDGK